MFRNEGQVRVVGKDIRDILISCAALVTVPVVESG